MTDQLHTLWYKLLKTSNSFSGGSITPVSALILSKAFLISSSFCADNWYSLSNLYYHYIEYKHSIRNNISFTLYLTVLFPQFSFDFSESLRLNRYSHIISANITFFQVFKLLAFFMLALDKLFEFLIPLNALINLLAFLFKLSFLLLSFFLQFTQLLFCEIPLDIRFTSVLNRILDAFLLVFELFLQLLIDTCNIWLLNHYIIIILLFNNVFLFSKLINTLSQAWVMRDIVIQFLIRFLDFIFILLDLTRNNEYCSQGRTLPS